MEFLKTTSYDDLYKDSNKVIKTLKQIYETKFREYEQTNFVNLPF